MLYFSRWKIVLIVAMCFLAFVMAIPSILPKKLDEKYPSWAYSSKVNLGLDLQGGSQLLLRVNFSAYLKDQLELLQDNLKQVLRSKKFGYRNFTIYDGSKVLFNVRNSEETESIITAIRKFSKDIVIIEKEHALEVSYTEEYLKYLKDKIIEQSIEIIRRRVDETGTREPSIQRQGSDDILLQVPGLNDPEHLKQVLGKTAKLTFHIADDNFIPGHSQVAPPGSMILQFETKKGEAPSYAIKRKAALSGDMLINASTTIGEHNQPAVQITFNNIGAKLFGEVTKENVGKLLAIVLDNKIISLATIKEPIMGGASIISGNFSVAAANDLSLLLRAGALPAPLEIVEERTIGPNLGADSIEAGKKAAIVAMILIMLFMMLSYGIPGIFANIALIINIILIIAALSILQATLTMPGIAGIILTMGMAVDANVLIFERIREELRGGLSPYAATDRGFKQAYGTILDSNITTIIVAIVLYIFGTGLVKGFGVTLTIGIGASMFSAITLTRMLMAFWVIRAKPNSIFS